VLVQSEESRVLRDSLVTNFARKNMEQAGEEIGRLETFFGR
jgi:hypothetical protein